MNKFYLMKLFIPFLLFITISKFSFAEIRINEVQNDIYLLDIYGNRSKLSKDYQIKTGDYLSTRKKPAIIVLNDNTKICFSTESSVKISKINFLNNNNKIHLEFKKGSVIFYVNENIKNNYNLSFFFYKLKNFKDRILLSKIKNLKIINNKNNLTLIYKNKKNRMNLPSYSISELSNNGKISKTTKLLKDFKFSEKFLDNCKFLMPTINKTQNQNLNLQYGCVARNGKLQCGNNFKQ